MKHLTLSRAENVNMPDSATTFQSQRVDFTGFEPYENVRVLHRVDGRQAWNQIWRVLVKLPGGREMTADWEGAMLMGLYIKALHEESNENLQFTQVAFIKDFRVNLKDGGNWHDVCSCCGNGYSDDENDEQFVIVDRAYLDENAEGDTTLCRKCQKAKGLMVENGGDDGDLFVPIPAPDDRPFHRITGN